MIRAQPMDAVVLIGGCDKTLPAQVMAAASVDLPTVVLPTGPMVAGRHRGERVGACTDCRRFWAQHRAGGIDAGEIDQIAGRLAPSIGTCGVMGTASTMACLVEALGLCSTHQRHRSRQPADRLPYRRSHRPPRCGDRRQRRSATTRPHHPSLGAQRHGRVAGHRRLDQRTHSPRRDRRPRRYSHRPATTSTQLGRDVPVLLNIKPSGAHYMEDFHYAGGMPALLRELAPLLDVSVPAVGGGTLADVDRSGRRNCRTGCDSPSASRP